MIKKQHEEVQAYLTPEISIVEVSTQKIVCISDPGDIPGDLEGGEWI